MSDDTDQLGDIDDGGSIVPMKRSDIRALEKKARAAEQTQAELAQMRRELAFRDAGIDPKADPRLQYFMKGYEGEATPDAIKEAATAAGFLQAPPPPPEQQGPSPAELQAMSRIAATTSGAQTPDLSRDAAFHTAMAAAQGQGPEAIMAVVQQFGLPTPGTD